MAYTPTQSYELCLLLLPLARFDLLLVLMYEAEVSMWCVTLARARSHAHTHALTHAHQQVSQQQQYNTSL